MWIYSFLGIQLLLYAWYFNLFAAYTRAFATKKLADRSKSGINPEEVSLLIPFRNEDKNLATLFKSLELQSYPEIQIIFIDDHSEDSGLEEVKKFCLKNQNARCLLLPEGMSGKKNALTFALNTVTSPWIMCTDADTTMGPDWVSTMINWAINYKSVFVSGPVTMIPEDSWFSRWQALEFSGLIAIGAAGMNLGRPTMCNGANLLYRREAFLQVGGFKGNEKIASGDDQFLMHRIHEQYPSGVHFCMDERAMVYTRTQASLKKFIQQRIRWASKGGQFEKKEVSFEMLGVWLVHLFLCLDLILGFFTPVLFVAFFIFFFLKLLIERKFYKQILPFFRQSELIKNFWLAEAFQVLYVVGVGLLSKWMNYEWKGRKHARRN